MSNENDVIRGGFFRPEWINVEDDQPSESGYYFILVQCLHDTDEHKKGAIEMVESGVWHEDHWAVAEEDWKVIYWAYPPVIIIPSELVSAPDSIVDAEAHNVNEEMGGLFPQPYWIRVEDALPPEDGDYFTLSEAQRDFNAIKKGTISVNDGNEWKNGEWYDESDLWKVLYWAYPVRAVVPAKYADRPRIGVL
ncbi:MAG: hypothetical protein IJT44_01390 [Clostridia bacterium]|nr:hypothetical protein [Clostridia bacterium]